MREALEELASPNYLLFKHCSMSSGVGTGGGVEDGCGDGWELSDEKPGTA